MTHHVKASILPVSILIKSHSKDISINFKTTVEGHFWLPKCLITNVFWNHAICANSSNKTYHGAKISFPSVGLVPFFINSYSSGLSPTTNGLTFFLKSGSSTHFTVQTLHFQKTADWSSCIKVRSYYTAIVLRCRYINNISAASHHSITAFHVKRNLTSCDTEQCNIIAWVCSAATQRNCGVPYYEWTFIITRLSCDMLCIASCEKIKSLLLDYKGKLRPNSLLHFLLPGWYPRHPDSEQ